MSNSIVSNENKIVVASKQSFETVNMGLFGGMSFSLPKLRYEPMKTGFSVVQGKEVTSFGKEAFVIIVGAKEKPSLRYYGTAYDPKAESRAPDCHSLNGITPDASVKNPQSKLCKNCPRRVWGTGRNGKGRECPDYRRLVVCSFQDYDDVNSPHTLMRFDVPPTSLIPLATYGKNELMNRGFAYYEVLTCITIDPEKVNVLKFTAARHLNSDIKRFVEENIYNSPEVIQALNAEVSDETTDDMGEAENTKTKEKQETVIIKEEKKKPTFDLQDNDLDAEIEALIRG